MRLNFRYISISFLALFLFGCSPTRQLEKKERIEVYGVLGLEYDRNDNFKLYKEAASWMGVPHVEGGTSRSGTDCSYLVQYIYMAVYDILLERNSENILKINCKKISKNNLREGDLVFFKTTNKNQAKVNHVGIYLKDHKFVHASSSRGVMVSNLDDDYWVRTWVCGGRVR